MLCACGPTVGPCNPSCHGPKVLKRSLQEYLLFRLSVFPSLRGPVLSLFEVGGMAKVQPPPLTALSDAPLRPLGGSKADSVPANELWKSSPSVVLVLRRPGCSACLCCSKRHAVHGPGVALFSSLPSYVECLRSTMPSGGAEGLCSQAGAGCHERISQLRGSREYPRGDQGLPPSVLVWVSISPLCVLCLRGCAADCRLG